ncbi:MAG: hypothetical protein ACLPYY_16275 [Acidimicrobiales bacterium]
MSTGAVVALVIVLAVVLVVLVAVVGSKAGRSRGYSGMGGETIVRCSQGHLFTTLWVPGASLKAVRLGFKRYQRCPVCEKWRIVVPVADSELSEDERRVAARHHDAKLP